MMATGGWSDGTVLADKYEAHPPGLLLARALAVRLVGVPRQSAVGPRDLAIVPDVCRPAAAWR
jgi:hypothetical protein